MTKMIGFHSSRYNGLPAIERMAVMAEGLDGKRLTYATLTAENGLDSGARG